MKKKILMAVAALAIMTVGTTAFAASSPDSSKVDTSTSTTASASTEKATESTEKATEAATESTETEALEAAADAYNENTAVKTDSGYVIIQKAVEPETVAAANTQAAGKSGYLISVVNLTPEGTGYVQGTAVTLTVTNTDIKVGRKYVVLHQKSDGSWETLPASVSKTGELTFTTTSFSAFAIVDIGADTSSNSADTTEAATADSGTSPKTGETTPVALFALLACVAGAFACSKKSEKN